MRRTIETRCSELCALFDVKQTLDRGMMGLQLRLDQIVLAYNLKCFEINWNHGKARYFYKVFMIKETEVSLFSFIGK